jgi:hypothetical protein
VGGKSSQAKGRAAEIELAHLLHEKTGYQVEPGQAVSYGATPDITGLPDIHVEVKRRERLNITAAMHQAEQDSAKFEDGAPTLFHRRNREPWLVTMRLDDWIRLYKGGRA